LVVICAVPFQHPPVIEALFDANRHAEERISSPYN
jgi:hypothetical protein